MRHQISSKYIGVWRNYSPYLSKAVKEMNRSLPRLRKQGALPYSDQINWRLDPLFDYNITYGHVVKGEVIGTEKDTMNSTRTTDLLNNEQSVVSVDGFDQNLFVFSTSSLNYTPYNESKNVAKKINDFVLDNIFEKIQTRVTLLASKSPQTFVMSDAQRVLRSESLGLLYQDFSFSSGCGPDSPLVVTPAQAQSAIRQLKYRNKDFRIDELIAVGHTLVNNSKHAMAIKLFIKLLSILYFIPETSILKKNKELLLVQRKFGGKPGEALLVDDRDSVVGILLGLGTSMAMSGRAKESVVVFSDSVKLVPTDVDVLTRRSEVYFSMDMYNEALMDVNDAILLTNDTIRERRFDRGRIQFLLKRTKAAHVDFVAASKMKSGDSSRGNLAKFEGQLWHLRGKCEREFGETKNALKSLEKSRRYDGSVKEVHLDTAYTLMEAARWNESLVFIDSALKIDPNYKNAFGYRGLLFQNLGRHKDALSDFNRALSIDPSDTQCMLLSGVCYHAIGDFEKSLKMFSSLLAIEPKHHAWYRKEFMLYSQSRFNDLLNTYNPDTDLSLHIREGLSQNSVDPLSPAVFQSYSLSKKSLPSTFSTSVRTNADLPLFNQNVTLLLAATKSISTWIQLDTPGFMPNKRLHASFGLQVLQMAQTLKKHIAMLKAGELGLLVPDAAASKVGHFGAVSCEEANCAAGHHVFGWRDFFDITTRWRQVSARS